MNKEPTEVDKADGETVPDIVAAMRGRAEDARVDRRLWKDYADRIEAAIERDRTSRHSIKIPIEVVPELAGNAAVMREALVICLRIIGENGIRSNVFLGDIQKAHEAITAALSAPARNCDLYNAVEDSWKDYKKFRSQIGEDVYFDMVHFWPFAKWLLAPAEKGGAE